MGKNQAHKAAQKVSGPLVTTSWASQVCWQRPITLFILQSRGAGGEEGGEAPQEEDGVDVSFHTAGAQLTVVSCLQSSDQMLQHTSLRRRVACR